MITIWNKTIRIISSLLHAVNFTLPIYYQILWVTSLLWLPRLGLSLWNLLYPYISVRMLHTFFYRFPIVLTKRIRLIFKSFPGWLSFPLFSWPHDCKEKLDAYHFKDWKVKHRFLHCGDPRVKMNAKNMWWNTQVNSNFLEFPRKRLIENKKGIQLRKDK